MAAQTLKRVDLPSGGWWEIEARPRWKHVRGLLHGELIGESRLPGTHRSSADLIDRVLVSLTTAWSFGDEIRAESLGQRDAADVIAVMERLKTVLSPLWEGPSPKSLAEDLLAGLASGRVPDEFAEAHIMALTGWSWQVLQDTPADVVEKTAIYLAVRQVREAGG